MLFLYVICLKRSKVIFLFLESMLSLFCILSINVVHAHIQCMFVSGFTCEQDHEHEHGHRHRHGSYGHGHGHRHGHKLFMSVSLLFFIYVTMSCHVPFQTHAHVLRKFDMLS